LPIDCHHCEIIEEIYQESTGAEDRDSLQWGAPETGAENPADTSIHFRPIDYLLIERIVEGGGNEIVRQFNVRKFLV